MVSELKIWSDLSELPRLRRFVADFCKGSANPLGEDSAHQLVLAVHEVAANIMEHAYQGRTDQLIKAKIEKHPDRYVVQLYHWGDSFDPENQPKDTPNGTKDRGYGLYIIQNCVDTISYSCDKKGKNNVSITKKSKQ